MTNTKFTFNRSLHALMLLIAVLNLTVLHAPAEAGAAMGLSLAFDPFDPAQPWSQRPIWQPAWLILTLLCALTLLGYSVGRRL